MRVYDKFKKHFSEDNLKKLFYETIVLSGATGIDHLSPKSFETQLDEQIKILSRKALCGNYKFSKYKLKLVAKGRGKPPREISIPTVRDRIALRALNDFLSNVFNPALNLELPQKVVKKVKDVRQNNVYSGFIKLDVSNYYPSIIHSELLSRLKKRIKSQLILDFIQSAISSPTVTSSSKHDSEELSGVPQGLATSNVLAAIYMINIDRFLSSIPDIHYFRYVDDILIFCNSDKANEIATTTINKFRRVGLEIHEPNVASDKSVIGSKEQPFSYLGYYFKGNKVSARTGTVNRLKDSIAAIFTAHKFSKYSNEEFLLWRLDLRITGCVHENRSKGWLFFFSEINDQTLLHELDNYVRKLLKRFQIKNKAKRFSRAFMELSHNKHNTKYIPNFDKYDRDQKLALLNKYFPTDSVGIPLTEAQINYHFNRRIKKQTKDLLEDIKDFTS